MRGKLSRSIQLFLIKLKQASFSVDIQSCRFDLICEPSFVCTFFYPSNSKTSNVVDCGNTFDQKKIVSALFDL